MGGPFNARNAAIGAVLGIVVYLALLIALRFFLRALPLNVAALVTLVVMLAYPGALVLGAVLSPAAAAPRARPGRTPARVTVRCTPWGALVECRRCPVWGIGRKNDNEKRDPARPARVPDQTVMRESPAMLDAANRKGTRTGAVATAIDISTHNGAEAHDLVGDQHTLTGWRQLLSDYIALTKPKIISLLLVTTLGAMMIAGAGFPSPWIVLWTLIGGALASGGAGAVNHFIDRDIDKKMGRTKGRPVVTGRIAPWQALAFGIVLEIASFALLAVGVNLLSAFLALAGYLFYVVVYTLWLKRVTPQNIVIGGAAGAFPPLVGWAAATGNLSLGALVLFAIVFFWTPPHFWALALLIRGDYERANVPMLPVVRGGRGDAQADPDLHRDHDRDDPAAPGDEDERADLSRSGGRARRLVPARRHPPDARADAARGATPLPLLAPLPRAPLPGDGDRPRGLHPVERDKDTQIRMRAGRSMRSAPVLYPAPKKYADLPPRVTVSL